VAHQTVQATAKCSKRGQQIKFTQFLGKMSTINKNRMGKEEKKGVKEDKKEGKEDKKEGKEDKKGVKAAKATKATKKTVAKKKDL